MNENILRPIALGQKAKTTRAIEPFDDGDLKAAGGRHLDMCARRAPSGGMHGARSIHRNNLKNLQSFRPVNRLADDAGSFISDLKPVLTQSSNVQKYIWGAVVRHDETISFRDVKPFHSPRNFNKANRFDRRMIRGRIKITPEKNWSFVVQVQPPRNHARDRKR